MTGTDHSQYLGILAGKVSDGDGRGRRRTHGREIVPTDQCLELAGIGIEQENG